MALGWIMAIARVWDAINDPLMGMLVDRASDVLFVVLFV